VKKFKFKLETVLAERKRVEDLRLREWTLARQILMKMNEDLQRMEDALARAIGDATKAASGSETNTGILISIDNYISGTKQRIKWKRTEIERGTKLTERKRMEYVMAGQKRKAIEKLKDRQLIQFKDDLRKRELKALDDIYIMSHAAKNRSEESQE